MSCWFSIASWWAMRGWWCETETRDPALEHILRSAESAFCYGRKHIIKAFGLLRFSEVASKTLLIFAVGETAGIRQGWLSEPTQAGMTCPLECFPVLFMTAPMATATLSFSSIGCQLSFFLALSKEKILLFARWSVFTELRVFGTKFWLWLCLMLLWSSAVCPSAPQCCIRYGCWDARFIAPATTPFSLLRRSADWFENTNMFSAARTWKTFQCFQMSGHFLEGFSSLCHLLWTWFLWCFAPLLWVLCHRFSVTSSGQNRFRWKQ